MARSQCSVIWKGINYDKYYSNATVARGVIQLIEVCRDIYEATANTIDAIEAKGVVKGSDKKEWVLAFVKSVVLDLGQNWEKYAQLISDFIDHIKSVYNTVKHLIK